MQKLTITIDDNDMIEMETVGLTPSEALRLMAQAGFVMAANPGGCDYGPEATAEEVLRLSRD